MYLTYYTDIQLLYLSFKLHLCNILVPYKFQSWVTTPWWKTINFDWKLSSAGSQTILHKIRRGLLRHDRDQILRKSIVSRLTWIYGPQHAGARGNEVANHSTPNATTTRSDMVYLLWTGRIYWDQWPRNWNSKRKGHVLLIYIYRGWRSQWMAGRIWRCQNQQLTGTASIHTVWWLLKQRVEHVWVRPQVRWY